MFRSLMALTVTGSVVSGLSAAPIVNVYPSVAPNVAGGFVPGAPIPPGPLGLQGTPGWRGYVPNALAGLQSANPAAAVVGTGAAQYAVNYNPVRQELTVSNQSLWRGVPNDPAFLSERGNRLHFGLVVRTNPGEAFNLNGISFNFVDPDGELLPDPIPSLGAVIVPGSPSVLGRPVGGGPLGPVTDPTQLLTELYYVGVGTAYDAFNDDDRFLIDDQFAGIPPINVPLTRAGFNINAVYSVQGQAVGGAAVPLPPAVAVFAGLVGLTAVARRGRRGRRAA